MIPRSGNSRSRRALGFTLIELMAVIMLTVLITAAVNHIFANLSRSSQRAIVRTKAVRQATAVLDHIARDLQESFLIAKPPEVDPLNHPWLFFSEEDGDSDRILFFTRNHHPRGGDPRDWDLTKVAYFLAPDEDNTGSLWRWIEPGIPAEYEKEFPDIWDPGVSLVSQNVKSLHFYFRNAVSTDWEPGWDSSQLENAGQLPLAVLIEVTMDDVYTADSTGNEDPLVYSRIVQLQIPIFIEAMMFGSGNQGEEDPICEERGLGLEVDDCLDQGHPDYEMEDDFVFDDIPKDGCFYNYIDRLLAFEDDIIDEYRHDDCHEAMENWREDTGQ